MGTSDQTGNELDEFVTDTLRNNLLGLPLDLATINMTRAREAGVPPLNELRRQIYDATGDGQLAPYTSWVGLRAEPQAPGVADQLRGRLRHAPDITSATTLAGKRAAAKAIVDPADPRRRLPTADGCSGLHERHGRLGRRANGDTPG